MNAPYTIAPARYAGRWNGKPQMAVRCLSDGTGFMTRAMHLCRHLKGRYSNREHAYIMSPTKAKRFEELFAAGYNATMFGELVAPREAVSA